MDKENVFIDFTETWQIVNTIFTIDAPLTRSQHLDINQSNQLNIPEIRIWLAVFVTICEDWLENIYNNSNHTERVAKDIEKWIVKESLSLNLIADAIYLAFKIEPDLFKKRFRMWLREEKEKPVIKQTEVFEFTIEPEPIPELFLDDYLRGRENS